MWQNQILNLLLNVDQLNSLDLQKKFNLSHEKLYAQLVSLSSLQYITLQSKKNSKYILSKQGQIYANQGTPQYCIFKLVSLQGTLKQQIEQILKDNFKIGLGNAMKKKMISMKNNKIYKSKQQFQDQIQNKLQKIKNNKTEQLNKQQIIQLKKRKLIQQKIQIYFLITKGIKYQNKKIQLKTQLTSEMIHNNSWQNQKFKQFNFEAKGIEIQNGNLHLLMKTKQQFTQIFLEMGFQEMQTNKYIQSSFWNFDVLFQPQAHPARDAHDTFFINDPQNSTINDKEYFEKIKNVHSYGGYGSIGYDYQWDENQAYKNLLRTHTTAVTSRYLRSIALDQPFKPRKFFSIDRVFRNQTLDQTHLAEFHQVQGVIIDRNLGLNHLIGTLTTFYKKIGINQIWLKPTYNPYTQPSMEIYGLHPTTKKKMQIGNSGLFRPQMLQPMGFDEDIHAIAWGLSLQRPTMIKYGLSNIKQLFGPSVSLKKVKDSPIYCL